MTISNPILPAKTDGRLPVGRPTKLTEPIVEIILASVRKGNYFVTAARAAGISDYTRMAWLKKAREAAEKGETGDTNKFVKFLQDILQAEAEGQENLLRVVQRQPRREWKAAAWLLERRWSSLFGPQAHAEVTDSDSNSLKCEVKLDFDSNTAQEVLRILAEAGAIRVGDAEPSIAEGEVVSVH